MTRDFRRVRERINRFSHPLLFPLILYSLVCFNPLLLGFLLFVVLPGGLRPGVEGVFQMMLACYPAYWVMWVYWYPIQAVNELPIPSSLFTRAGFKAAAKDFSSDPRQSLLASFLFLTAPSAMPLYVVGFFFAAAASGHITFKVTGSAALALPVAIVVGLLASGLTSRLVELARERHSVSHERRVGQAGTQAEAKRKLRRGRSA